MATIVTRAGKGSPLTNAEVDANFVNLNDAKLENGDAVSFSSIDIITSGTDAQIAPNTGITGWKYSGLSFSVGSQETAPNGLFISPDGLNMYVNGSTGDDVNQYTLSTAWDISTATFVRVFSTSSQDSGPADIFFKPDGLSMFVMGQTNDRVFQYDLATAWDISTASYASKSFSVTSQEATPTGLWFKSDGTVMYVIGSSSDTVFQYDLATAWDVSTASYASISFSVGSQEASPTQVNLSADGLTMWVLGVIGDEINEYALGTAWNVSTATFVNNFYVGFQDINPSGLFIDSTAANRVYLVGTTFDTVYQYNTATNSISAVTDVFNTTSNARVQGNLAVKGNAVVDGTFAAQGSASFGGASTFGSSLTATSTITLQGTTTSTIALGTSVSSGTITIGGTAGTGTIVVGQSTISQTTNIQAGATASGSTKTLNIGTAGVSGSTTAINIGSAVSGATSTTTLNGTLSLQNALPVAQGGTGSTTAANALTALGAYAATNPNGYTTNTGTVTSITAGTGLSGGTITTSGTIALANTAVTAGAYTTANITVDAQGRITAASSGTGGLVVSNDTTTNATRYPVFEDITSGTATTMQVSSTKYTFNPSTGTLSATVMSASSDERLKENWTDVAPDFLSKLAQVKHGVFSRKDNGNREAGVGAQSFMPVLPEAVVEGEDGLLSVNYGGAALVAAIELAKVVEELRVEVARLKAKVGE